MNEFIFVMAVTLFTAFLGLIWVITVESIKHGYNCWHKWDKWGALVGNNHNEQYRCCKKCNKMEKRTV